MRVGLTYRRGNLSDYYGVTGTIKFKCNVLIALPKRICSRFLSQQGRADIRLCAWMQIFLINLRVIYFAPIGTKTTIMIKMKPWSEIDGDQGKRNTTYQSRKHCCLLCDNDLWVLGAPHKVKKGVTFWWSSPSPGWPRDRRLLRGEGNKKQFLWWPVPFLVWIIGQQWMDGYVELCASAGCHAKRIMCFAKEVVENSPK